MPLPPRSDAVSESAPTFKTAYPRRIDPLGMKFSKGHRTQTQVSGTRPVFRAMKRPTR